MYDLETARRRNRWVLGLTLALFVGALSLFITGYRGLAGWAVLLSCTLNLLGAIIGRRTLARHGTTLAGVDQTGSQRASGKPDR